MSAGAAQQSPVDRLPGFPFIVGSGRSGTTLLRSMLDSHPDLAVPPESAFLPEMIRRRRRYERGTFHTGRFVHDLESSRFRGWGIPIDDVALALRRRPPTGLEDAVRTTYAVYAAAQGTTRYGEKTPRYVFDVESIAGLLHEARFLHVIRDGRDVALSYLDFRYGPDTLLWAARHWRDSVEAGRGAAEALGPDRYLEVRYENLVSEPEPVLRRVAQFCELDFDPAMLDHRRSAEGWISAATNPSEHARLRESVAAKRNWRTEMHVDDVVRFEAVAGRTLERCGYPLEGRRASADALVAIRLWNVVDRIRVQIKRGRAAAGRVSSRRRSAD